MLRMAFKFESDRKLVTWLRGKEGKLKKALIEKMNEMLFKLVHKIQTEKLQGQVLQHRSGRLSGSIRSAGAHEENGQIVGTVEGAGGAAWYGVVHEYGGTRAYPIVPVNKKALAFFPSGSAGAQLSKTDLRALYFGPIGDRSLKGNKYSQFAALGGVVVKSVMHPPLPKRSFMASALEEMTDEIQKEMQKTVNSVLNA